MKTVYCTPSRNILEQKENTTGTFLLILLSNRKTESDFNCEEILI